MGVGMAVVGLSSCGQPAPSDTEQSGTQEVEFWTMQLQPDFTDYFNTLIAEYEAANPDTTIRWVDVPLGRHAKQNSHGSVRRHSPGCGQPQSRFCLPAGQSQCLVTPRMAQLPRKTNRFTCPKFGRPIPLMTPVLACPGISPPASPSITRTYWQKQDIEAPPSTFEELAIAAKTIREKTGKYAFFITFVADDAADVLQSLVKMGVTLVDDEGKAAFNTAEGKAAFQYWVDLYQAELLPS